MKRVLSFVLSGVTSIMFFVCWSVVAGDVAVGERKAGAERIDQSFKYHYNCRFIRGPARVGQTFVVGRGVRTISSIELFMENFFPVRISLYDTPDKKTKLGESLIVPGRTGWSWKRMRFHPPIHVREEGRYYFEMELPNRDCKPQWCVHNNYSEGEIYINGVPNRKGDLLFRTWTGHPDFSFEEDFQKVDGWSAHGGAKITTDGKIATIGNGGMVSRTVMVDLNEYPILKINAVGVELGRKWAFKINSAVYGKRDVDLIMGNRKGVISFDLRDKGWKGLARITLKVWGPVKLDWIKFDPAPSRKRKERTRIPKGSVKVREKEHPRLFFFKGQ